MLISNYVHLPISTSNASTSSLERDNAKKRGLKGPKRRATAEKVTHQ